MKDGSTKIQILLIDDDPFDHEELEFSSLAELLEARPALESLFSDNFLWAGSIEIINNDAPFHLKVKISIS